MFDKELLEDILSTMMDCIEDSVSAVSAVRGRKMFQAFLVCIAFLSISLIALLLKITVVITWQEALPACIMTGYLAFMESINKAVMKGLRKSLGVVGKRNRR